MTGRRAPHVPELLAPAGDAASLAAALAAGADAVYFGLDEGFNARARAANFSLASLPDAVARIHLAGARAYVTLNTLVFEEELPAVARLVRAVAEAGADALIVQDPAVCLIAREICPALELHASTQMTVSSPEAAELMRALGVRRVVVPRELSVAEIARFAAGTSVELEVFVHGALCVSWSGQCLTSEAWGGRSANRGQCAQSCRMPYGLVVDGEDRDLGDVAYLLSPGDLAGARAVPDLVALGVHGLKIEGRQKGPAYVASAVAGYRRWLDALAEAATDERGRPSPSDDARRALGRDLADMRAIYSRGFGDGFFAGSDHQSLVDGRSPRHRGAYLGRVRAVDGDVVVVTREPLLRVSGGLGSEAGQGPPVGEVASPLPAMPELDAASHALELRAGVGVVFDDGRPEEEEPGGPVFAVEPEAGGPRARVRLRFGRPGPDLSRVRPGQRVWITRDPEASRRAERLVARGDARGRIEVRLAVRGQAGEPLAAALRCASGVAEARTTARLAPARGPGLDHAVVIDKLGALGDTPFRLAREGGVDLSGLDPGLHVPVSELKALRRALVASLEETVRRGPRREVREGDALARARAEADTVFARLGPLRGAAAGTDAPRIVPLCRTDAQLEAVIDLGLPEVELDWMELVGLGRAVARAREAGLRVVIATVRVQKPGEEGYDARIARLRPDGVLVRHWGALAAFARAADGEPGARDRAGERPALHGDFSLNVTNALTAARVLALGLDTFTAAHDLDAAQLRALVARVEPSRVTVALYHHIPTFHTEHCVYAHLLSRGRDYRSCGRPCERHEVSLRDRTGDEHPVIVDVGCRNTVFNARAQSAARLVPSLVAAGVRRFRVELVRESREEAARVLGAHVALLEGRLDAARAVREAGAHEQFGVTQGTMEVMRG